MSLPFILKILYFLSSWLRTGPPGRWTHLSCGWHQSSPKCGLDKGKLWNKLQLLVCKNTHLITVCEFAKEREPLSFFLRIIGNSNQVYNFIVISFDHYSSLWQNFCKSCFSAATFLYCFCFINVKMIVAGLCNFYWLVSLIYYSESEILCSQTIDIFVTYLQP